MAHSARYDTAVDLAQSLGAGLALDDGTLGETRNGDHAWACHDRDADFHVVLQDDALPIPGFAVHAAAALAARPASLVSFYVGTGRPRQHRVSTAIARATVDGCAWLSAETLLWGVAVAMPTEHIAPFLDWAADSRLPYDRRLGAYANHAGLPIHYTHPSLVDHADGPTLLRHPWGPPRAPRHAWVTGTPTTWDTGTVVI